jgi:hypothetical protein
MKFSICTAKNITENLKKGIQEGYFLPKTELRWYYSFLEGMKEIGKVSSRSFYYYLLLYPFFLFMCFTGDLLHHPTKVKVEAQIVDQTFPCLSKELLLQ